MLSPIQLALNDGRVATLLTNSSDAVVPGAGWLIAQDASVWVSTESLPAWNLEDVNADDWLASNDSDKVIEVTKELNGDVQTLANRFKRLLSEKAPSFLDRLERESIVSISYEDRYLRSPWNVLLLAGFMQLLRSEQLNKVVVTTVASQSKYDGEWLWDNWNNVDDMVSAVKQWLSAALGVEPEVSIHNSLMEVSHRRVLTLELESGSSLKLAFDQGMGYWQCTSLAHGLKKFNFSQDSEGQAKQMLERWKGVKMLNGGDWPTDIAFYEAG